MYSMLYIPYISDSYWETIMRYGICIRGIKKADADVTLEARKFLKNNRIEIVIKGKVTSDMLKVIIKDVKASFEASKHVNDDLGYYTQYTYEMLDFQVWKAKNA